MKIFFFLFMVSLFSFSAGARTVRTSQCSSLDYISDLEEKKSYVINSQYDGGTITWEQDGRVFSMQFDDLRSDVYSSRSTLSFGVDMETKVDGRVVASKAERHVLTVMKGKLTTRKALLESTREYKSDVEYVSKGTLDGTPTANITVTTKNHLDGAKTVISRFDTQTNERLKLRTDDRTTTCVYRPVLDGGEKKKFDKMINAAINKFDTVLAKVETATAKHAACVQNSVLDCTQEARSLESARADREKLFPELISGKVFLAAKKSLNPVPKPPRRTREVPYNPGHNDRLGQDNFGGPSGRGCREFGRGLSCDNGIGAGDSNCTEFGSGYHCSRPGGDSEVCTPFGSGYHCSGSGGSSVCTPFGSGYHCSP